MSREASDDEQAVVIGQGLLENGVIHHGELQELLYVIMRLNGCLESCSDLIAH